MPPTNLQVNRRTLLLTSIAPTTAKTGGIVLNQLVKLMPKGSLVCAVVPDRLSYPRIDENLNDIPIKYFLRLNEYPRTFIPSKISQLIDRYYINTLTNKITAFGKQQQTQAVWCVLENLTQIFLAKTVADRLGVPLLTQVWDPPSWWLRVRRVRHDYADRILRMFDEDIRQSKACAVTSWAMADAYQKKYDAKTIIFLPSLPAEMAHQPAIKPNNENTLTLALAGQVYAYDAWESLIRALDSVQWKISGRMVNIYLFGRHDKVKPLNHPNIIKVGWTSQTETIQRLSEMDILYCPYWFNPDYKEETDISFPSKLITYYASGRPVFYHGPESAGPAIFINQHQAGYVCTSQETNRIIQGLAELTENADKYHNYSQAGYDAFNKYFTLDNMATAFQGFINA